MKKWKRWGVNLLVNIPIMLLSLTCIFPVVWLLYSSLKTDVEFARSPISLPAVPNFGNYVTAFQRASFGTFTFNSVFNSIISLVLVLVISFTLPRTQPDLWRADGSDDGADLCTDRSAFYSGEEDRNPEFEMVIDSGLCGDGASDVGIFD